ncbi:hypothetical protein D3C79_867700 [compost metagenome]
MFIRECQQIKALHFPVHLRQLGIATNQLFDRLPGLGAVEAGFEDGRGRPGTCMEARCRAQGGGEERGQKGRDHFHAGFTRINARACGAMEPIDPVQGRSGAWAVSQFKPVRRTCHTQSA